ncbi:hypothetical protein [Longitalea luteola]|uniref:hypothetical protein n=1 Tax=Longitalea luteola TaxID=2812563 RepID=UPI001A97C442|nr:hypothetical protein [Longitalea luteola]
MKRNVLYNLLLLPLALLIVTGSMSQTSLEPDQNPDYMISQVKYARMADSINRLHGTTPQETYKAIDWMADRQAAREQRRAFRRELRLERARNGYGWYYNDFDYYYPRTYSNYYPVYSRGYGSYYPVYSRGYGYYPYRRYWNRNYWNLVPLAATAATVGWLLTR